ncbi:cytochrome c oxidase subunit II [Marinivivus vitaminiproducens]|uniref:cytochrome c oxidase subunit II n=1 Tax=Marinivivus vitaminiproducens TaxID=3035935 RepID=UPI002798767C|nr:cytochrome c oxidase subunit II [Geminicoccaceae bacterium SCSIO 64248]
MLPPFLLAVAAVLASGAAHANAPIDWGMGMQPAAGPVKADIVAFHDLLLWVTGIICLIVLALLAYACVRFRASANPTPSRRTHHTLIEVVWTAVPVLVLVVIAIPSFKLLYFMDKATNPEMTIKATGHQWYWSYEYPDNGNFYFDAYMIPDTDLQPGQLRLLETDNRVVIPAGTDIRILVTAGDVLHSWAMPSMGVKTDAVPGRVNETWIRAEEPGVYYGQCSELCGQLHGFMPITIEAKTREEFDAWAQQAAEEFAKADGFDVAAGAPAATPPAN